MEQLRRVVFLDRDGTINVDYGYLHRRDQLSFLPGAIDGLKLFQEMGFDLVVITNQSGIGRGMFTFEDYYDFQSFFDEELAKVGVNISATYFCPHTDEDNCNCRKPKTELYERAVRELNIDVEKSFAIGDNLRDVAVCEAIKGVQGFLISASSEGHSDNIRCVGSLLEAAEIIRGSIGFDEK